MTRVLTKIVHWHQDLDFGAVLKSLPEEADIAALNERIQPSSAASTKSRGWRASVGTRHPVLRSRCRFMTKTMLSLVRTAAAICVA